MLAVLLKKRGITQKQLAQKIGVTQAAISKWVVGRNAPKIKSLQSVARIFPSGAGNFNC